MQSEYTSKDIARFWGKVDKEKSNTFYNETRCWEWTAGCDTYGYGEITIGGENGRNMRAHRISYELLFGEIPDKLFVLHHCDNRACVNFEHLFLGTNQDNVDDMVNKGRQMHGDEHYSYLHPEKLARGDAHYSRLHPEKLARGDKHWSHIHPEKIARGDRHFSHLYPEKLARGESNGNAKLTEEKVADIRRRHAQGEFGGESTRVLAKEYGVSQSVISAIVNYKTWK